MKPISLTLSAFGPFSDTQKIQFSDFTQNALFLINGPTGAGKTTILDGICFALYGRTTGNEREGSQMRCDMASDTLLTEVVFEFVLGDYQYRIRRVPEQARKKSRGDGFTQQKPEAQLYRTDDEGNVSLLVETKVSDATAFIEDILGLDVDQFRQVMVLPQGKFRDLLMADSKSREKIFGQLFQTQIYRRMEEKLKQQASDIRQQVQVQRNKREGILQSAELSSDEELETRYSEVQPIVAQAKIEKDQQHKALIEITQKLESLKQLKQKFNELENALAVQTQLKARSAEINDKQQQLLQAQAAEVVMPSYHIQQQRLQELQSVEAQLKTAQQNLNNAYIAKTEINAQFEQIPNLESQLQNTEQHRQQLTELEPLLMDKSRVGQSIVQTQQNHDSAQTQFISLSERLKQLHAQKKGLQTQLPELRIQASKQTDLQNEQFDVQQQLEKLNQLNNKKLEQAKLSKQLDEAKLDGMRLKTSYQTTVEQHKQLKLNWHQSQAAILALQLTEQQACPVCGSQQHPSPASATVTPPTEIELQQAQDSETAALTLLNEARSSYSHIHSQLKQLDVDNQKMIAELGDLSTLTITECEQKQASIRQQLVQAQSAQKQLNQAELSYQKLEQSEVELQAELEQKRTTLNSLSSELIGLQTRLAEIDKRLTDDAKDIVSLKAQLKELTELSDNLRRKVADIRQNHSNAGQNHSACEASLSSLSGQHRVVTESVQQAKEVFTSALEQAEFNNVQALLSASLLPEIKQALDIEIKQFQQKDSINQAKISDLQSKLENQQMPELDQINQAYTAQQQKLEHADKEYQSIQNKVSQIEEVQKQLKLLDSSASKLEDEYKVVGTLADVANGHTGNRISLNRFVLSVLLDDVLLDASKRLHIMSKGRYRLLRKEDKAKGNKASGLELEVEDGYTSKVRDVATLSGGESFMAALSLALALSEVVQAYAGGIKLDTLFIDEGFGSLDQDSLELAIRTLIDLQASGRMIGVISHVTEMKEQIEHRIDIVKSSSGSQIKLRAS